ncbi:DUF2237 family protein [Cypionkella sp.]|jgi:uncharacterized protein (DUF2237 family)|uniref:DUF2237 family protein n=1 Tax=Cypionkella sp. TaxID=2811411 RepID=UPI002719BD49|nr:DUF2237 domain-containing protein [Cypionkella sp.]MDO8983092.1 DUF2237 domain-containing protein [Cypionkella sp.]MDP2050747.1 DUF2237 domain-containing protein [Cypionkella sp.]
MRDPSLNVLGSALESCSSTPITGFFRDGCCNTGPMDQGLHTVCALLTAEFLAYSKYLGNDLSTPRPEYGFAGLKPGDQWCLCAGRFLQAHNEGVAPQILLKSTHQRTLDVVALQILQTYAAD